MLLFNSASKNNRSTITKAKLRWLGLYRIYTANSNKGNYTLKEMDGTIIYKPITGHRIKQFYTRDTINLLAGDTPAEPIEINIGDNIVTPLNSLVNPLTHPIVTPYITIP